GAARGDEPLRGPRDDDAVRVVRGAVRQPAETARGPGAVQTRRTAAAADPLRADLPQVDGQELRRVVPARDGPAGVPAVAHVGRPVDRDPPAVAEGLRLARPALRVREGEEADRYPLRRLHVPGVAGEGRAPHAGRPRRTPEARYRGLAQAGGGPSAVRITDRAGR